MSKKYNDEDIQLVEVGEGGEEMGGASMARDARKPDDKYEMEFLKNFPNMKYFPSRASHKRFKEFRDKMQNGTDQSILYRGWFKNVMKWVAGKNMGRLIIGVDAALSRLHNEPAFLEWSTKKEAREWLATQKSFGQVAKIAGKETKVGRSLTD